MTMFSEIPIITSPYLTESKDRIVRRSWRERLCAWPWCPWVSHKTISVQVPSKSIYFVNGAGIFRHDGYVMHPITAERTVPRILYAEPQSIKPYVVGKIDGVSIDKS